MKKINNKIKLFWGISEVGFSFMSTVETTFFVIFLTDVAQLPLALVAAITSVAGIADAITAMLAGVIIDKVNFKHGKYRPWLIYLPPFVVAFFVLMFTKIGSDPMAALLCGLGYVLSHAIWNICWTANRTLVGELTDDPEERAFLSGRISAGSSAGKILASYFVPVLNLFFLGIFASSTGVIGYTMTALIASVTFTVCYLIHFAITKGYDEPKEVLDENAKHAKSILFKDMGKSIVSNPQLLLVLIFDFLKLIGYYTLMATVAYYAKVVLQDESAMSIILVVFNVGALVGSLISKNVVAKLGSKMTNIVGVLGFAVCLVVIYVMPANMMIVTVLLGIAQIFFGISYGNTTSLYSNCGTYSEYKTGKNTKAVIMSFSSLAIKISIAVRGIVITSVLSAVGYHADAAITSSTVSGIKILCLVVPIIFLVVSIIPLLGYKIKDSDIAIMEKELQERESAN